MTDPAAFSYCPACPACERNRRLLAALRDVLGWPVWTFATAEAERRVERDDAHARDDAMGIKGEPL